jgi:proteasome lid subunit RPN8/RPN11
MRSTLSLRQPKLVFAPLAWLKLQYFCHRGETEVAGFGITAPGQPLYIEEFVTLPQDTTAVSVAFRDDAVADFFDRCVDRKLPRERFARIWLHTHPGASVTPSATDEETYARVFGRCDWAVMAINYTHARAREERRGIGREIINRNRRDGRGGTRLRLR